MACKEQSKILKVCKYDWYNEKTNKIKWTSIAFNAQIYKPEKKVK